MNVNKSKQTIKEGNMPKENDKLKAEDLVQPAAKPYLVGLRRRIDNLKEDGLSQPEAMLTVMAESLMYLKRSGD